VRSFHLRTALSHPLGVLLPKAVPDARTGGHCQPGLGAVDPGLPRALLAETPDVAVVVLREPGSCVVDRPAALVGDALEDDGGRDALDLAGLVEHRDGDQSAVTADRPAVHPLGPRGQRQPGIVDPVDEVGRVQRRRRDHQLVDPCRRARLRRAAATTQHERRGHDSDEEARGEGHAGHRLAPKPGYDDRPGRC
jgi:hypothetical protein